MTTPAPSPRQRLAEEPTRFDLDQAVHVLADGRDPVDMPYAAAPRLDFPLGEVTAAQTDTGRITTPLFGLIGPGGTLPRHYTATAASESRARNQALQAFMELLARRFTGMWVKAGAKYRPTRNPAPAEQALASLIGLATPGLQGRLPLPDQGLRYHAGHLAARTRSASRLAAMLSEEAGMPVEIIEFAGGWLRLPVTEQSRLGTSLGRLGQDAVAGAQFWDPQARFIIRLGPLDAAQFARLLPGSPLFARLSALARLFVGPEQDFVLNPVLAADAVPPARLGADGARLGLTSWTGTARPRQAAVADTMLRPSG